MKKISTLLAAVLTLAACSSPSKPQEAAADADSAAQMSGPQPSSSDLQLADTLKLGDHTFVVSIQRRTDKALPTVEDEMGTTFYDNSVDVGIRRDGEQVFTRTFTKDDFAASLPEKDTQRGVLLGMALDGGSSTASGVVLTAQVGEPGLEDEATAFSITVTSGRNEPLIRRVQNQLTSRDDMLGEED